MLLHPISCTHFIYKVHTFLKKIIWCVCPASKLLAICTGISLLITAYCFLEYQLPYSQYAKVLSELKAAGINDKELIARIRWSILGVQTTWKPLFALTLLQNGLLCGLTIAVLKQSRKVEWT
jgi:hypothetical protein